MTLRGRGISHRVSALLLWETRKRLRAARWLETSQAAFFSAAVGELGADRDDLLRRLELPPEDTWPEPWDAEPAAEPTADGA